MLHAVSLSFFVDSTSSTTKWPHSVGYNTRMFAAQEANGRYHVSLWDASGDTNGWVSTAWVRPSGDAQVVGVVATYGPAP
ncbi:hypothetical protein [Micromonospora humidisoli]|uniref:SH3 domain-containing protein n=1 Tax=Micromonospora humidisoli TaxID=2807622 RepID=A0ABS2JHK5_9ACTN|nr:hypothetical protein [Micromonospora humidisoli]MBM7085992.1 hypothetical protein [Micromonospora humidisoli]